MKIKRSVVLVSAAVIGLTGCVANPQKPGDPSLADVGARAGGAALGGVLGNQVGSGRGRTAATALGAAAGTVIASGCRVGWGTVLGGVAGAILGSQVGDGRARDIAAGVGASVGATLGAYFSGDCSPVDQAAAPEPLAGFPVLFNGVTLTPMSGFPLEAFHGVPPIVTVQDLQAAAALSRRLTEAAIASQRAGDSETAVLQMYWAKRIGLAAMAVADASIAAIADIGPSGTVGRWPQSATRVAPKSLVILPAFVAGDAPVRQASVDWSAGIQVADANPQGAFRLLANAPAPATPEVAMPSIGDNLKGIPEHVVLRLDSGAMVMRTGDSLTIYNPGEGEVAVPLSQLNFIPKAPDPSAARQAAAGLMKTITENRLRWFANTYHPSMGRDSRTIVRAVAPNELRDFAKHYAAGGKEAGYVDANGRVSSYPAPAGIAAYKTGKEFRLAMDLLVAVDHAAPVLDFAASCGREKLGYYSDISGPYANLATSVCHESGSLLNARQVHTRTFWIGEDGKAIQTMESLMKDKAVMTVMAQAAGGGKLASDMASLLPVLGNVEGGMQCFGKDTIGVQVALSRAASNVGGYAKARLAGWKPSPNEWSAERVAACVSMIPTGNYAGAIAKKVVAGGDRLLAGLPNAERVRDILRGFEAPTEMKARFASYGASQGWVPGNVRASEFVHNIYELSMTGQSMFQISESLRVVMNGT